jgi:iron-sulfur cluster assembly protein
MEATARSNEVAPSNEVVPSNEAAPASEAAPSKVVVTDSAVREIRRLAEKRGTPNAALRAGIRGGGCTGFAYLFEWDDNEPKERDQVIERDGVRVYVDPKSMLYLQGTELDFVRSIMGYGFKFNNPNVKGTCGCGESVQF